MIKIGKDAKQMISDLLIHVRNLLIVKFTKNPETLIGTSKENINKLSMQSEKINSDELKSWIRYLSKKVNQARYSTMPRIILEVAIIEMIGDTSQGEKRIKKDVNLERTKNVENVEKIANIENIPNIENIEKTDKKDIIKEVDNIGFDEMWDKILDEVATGDIGFNVIVGANSRITDYKDGEIILTVKPSKLSFAKESLKKLDEAAKKLFGQETFITIVPGDIVKDKKARTDDKGDESVDSIGKLLKIDSSKIEII